MISESDIKVLTDYPIVDYCNLFYGASFKKNGKYYITCCIFDDHKDNTPSFVVDPITNYFFCNGKCQRKGNLINIVKEKENMGFIDACKTIAGNIGYKLNLQPPKPEHEAYKNTHSRYMERYYNNLWGTYTKEVEDVIAYLKSRGFTEETIKEFGIGYTPKDEYKNRNDISNIGSRISIPIFENISFDARVIAHSFRTMKDVLDPVHYNSREEVKYKNDKTSTGECEGVWSKGNTFYNYHKALPYIRICKCAIIVEGFFDVIALWQSGIKNVLGNMTSILNENLATKLSTITKDVIIFLDNDDTGAESTNSAIISLLSKGVTVKVVSAMNGKDPADFCKSKGFDQNEIGRRIYSDYQDAWKYLVDKKVNPIESEYLSKKLSIYEEFIPIMNNLSESARIVYMDYLNKKLNIKG